MHYSQGASFSHKAYKIEMLFLNNYIDFPHFQLNIPTFPFNGPSFLQFIKRDAIESKRKERGQENPCLSQMVLARPFYCATKSFVSIQSLSKMCN